MFVEEIGTSLRMIIESKAYHHLGMVLRAKLGEEVLLMDRRGKRAVALVEEIRRGSIVLKIKEMVSIPVTEGLELVVIQAILKNQANDYLIQRLSELGVEGIAFFEARRGISRWSRKKTLEKLSHWDGVVIRSFLQCDRDVPIKILGPFLDAKEVAEFYKDLKGLKLVFHEKGSFDFKEVLKWKEHTDEKRAILAVGPEGGFTDEEIELFQEAQFIPTCLGPRVLKAESVAMVAASIVQYTLGDLNRFDR